MKRVFKVLSIIIICLIIFCLSIYFIATNSFFIKNVVFPVAGKIYNFDMQAEKIVISPFAGDFEFQNLIVKSKNGYSIKVNNFNANVNLYSMYKGIIKINHLNILDTNIDIVQEIAAKEENVSAKDKSANYYRLSYDDLSDMIILDISNIKVNNLNIKCTVKRLAEKQSSVMELSNFNLTIPQLITGEDGTINFKGLLQAGPEKGENKINGKLTGEIFTKISNNSIPELIKINSTAKFGEEVTPVKIVFESKRNKALQTLPFGIKVNVDNFPLLPLFKAFVDGSFSDATGKINKLSLDAAGSDLFNIDIYRNINCEFKTNVNNLVLPVKVAKYGLFKILFLPIEILSKLNEYTKSNIVPGRLENVFQSANSITKGLSTMKFDENIFNISLQKGKLNLKKIEMNGGTLSAVRGIYVKGYVDLPNQIDIKTKTSFAGIIIPLAIKGTIEAPKPDLTMLLPGMVLGTAKNLVETGLGVTKDVTVGITKGGINAGKKLGSVFNVLNIINPTQETETTNSQDKKDLQGNTVQ